MTLHWLTRRAIQMTQEQLNEQSLGLGQGLLVWSEGWDPVNWAEIN